VVIAAALMVFLLARPNRLIGESAQAEIARQHQTAKLEAWLS